MAAITDLEVFAGVRQGAMGGTPDEPPHPLDERHPPEGNVSQGLFPTDPTEWLRRWLLGDDLALSRWLEEEQVADAVHRIHERALRGRRALAERMELRMVRHQLEMARRSLHRVPSER